MESESSNHDDEDPDEDQESVLTGRGDQSSTITKRKRNGGYSHASAGAAHDGDGDNNVGSHDRTSLQVRKISMKDLIDPNFEELARQFAFFRRAWNQIQEQQQQYQYQQQQHQRNSKRNAMKRNCFATQAFTTALTRALLQIHFGISVVHQPESDVHLCPPVPNRYVLVQWIQETLRNEHASAECDSHHEDLPANTSTSNHNHNSINPHLYLKKIQPHRPISRRTGWYGLDIGTGAYCIYPLLMVASSRTDPVQYHMYATDIDPESCELARNNLLDNRLDHVIQVIQVPPSDAQLQDQQQQHQSAMDPLNNVIDPSSHTTIAVSERAQRDLQTCFPEGPLRKSLASISPHVHRLDFAMTNPPFYDSTASFTTSNNHHDDDGDDNNQMPDRARAAWRNEPHDHHHHRRRRRDGRPRTAMTCHEGSYPGGEVGFVLDMFIDGLYLYLHQPQQVPTWCYTMIGKKSSYTALVHILQQVLGFAHVRTTQFGPGQLTRWFIAWTYDRPTITSPYSHQTTWDFIVNIPGQELPIGIQNGNGNHNIVHDGVEMAACEQVVARVQEACQTMSGLATLDVCKIRTITANKPNAMMTHWTIGETNVTCGTPLLLGDEALPVSLQRILSTTDHLDPVARVQAFLPPQGHFVIHGTATVIRDKTNHTKNMGHGESQEAVGNGDHVGSGAEAVPVHIELRAYQHSLHGKTIVSYIQSRLQGEISRTNRRWRRRHLLHQQENDQQQQHNLLQEQKQADGFIQPMDES